MAQRRLNRVRIGSVLCTALVAAVVLAFGAIAGVQGATSPARPLIAIREAHRIEVFDAKGRTLGRIPLNVTKAEPPARMRWSPDGVWLAVATARGVFAWQRARAQVRELVPVPSAAYDVTLAWSPHADVLLVTEHFDGSSPGATHSRTFLPGRTLLVDPLRGVRMLAPFAIDASGVLWNGDGREPNAYIVYAQPPYASWSQSRDELVRLSARDGVPDLKSAQRIAVSAAGGQISPRLAGLLPGGAGALYWQGDVRSASVAADGQDLELASRGAAPRRLGFTLENDGYVALAPGGDRVAFVEGAGRMAWSGKHLRICALRQIACAKPPAPAKTVTLDLVWSPRGDRLAFVRATDVGSNVMGFSNVADYRRWLASRSLWVADPTGREARRIATGDIWWPRWSPDGKYLAYVRDRRLWLARVDGTEPPRAVTAPLRDGDEIGYYGNRSNRDDPYAVVF